MKVYSAQAIAKIFIGLSLIFWILVLSIVVSNHALSCIDTNGCLRPICDFNWLLPEYQQLVLDNNYKCPYQNTTWDYVW